MSDVDKLLKDTKQKMEQSFDAAKREFSNIRTGRASTALIEGVMVDYFGATTPLNQLASITTPDAKSLAVSPWDVNALGEIEKALLKSDLGLNPMNDGKIIRIQVPALTSERRDELSKIVRKLAEEGRVGVRNARQEANELVKKMSKDKEIPEDRMHAAQKDIQKMTDELIKQIDDALKQKEADIQAV